MVTEAMTERLLTTRELEDHLARLSYKPGWEFSVYEDAWEGPHVFIVARLPDAFKPGRTIDLGVRSAIPRWLLWRLHRIESHEAREFFRRDGSILFNPHA